MRGDAVVGSHEIGSNTTLGIWFLLRHEGLVENGGATLQMKGWLARAIGRENGIVGAGLGLKKRRRVSTHTGRERRSRRPRLGRNRGGQKKELEPEVEGVQVPTSGGNPRDAHNSSHLGDPAIAGLRVGQ